MAETVLITGANRGIGLAMVREFLSNGHRVIAGSRFPEESKELRELQTASNDRLTLVRIDVDLDSSVEEACQSLSGRLDALDILINNAGLFPEEGDESILDMELAHFRAAFETNVLGAIRMIRTFLPLLEKADRPRVINVSSGAGSISQKTDFDYYAYSTSKAALNMVTRAIAAELKGRRVTVVALTPGWVKTRMGGDNAPLSPEDSARAIVRTALDLSSEQSSLFLDREGRESSFGW